MCLQTRKDTKLCMTKQGPTQNPAHPAHSGSNNITTALEWTAALAIGGLNAAFYWHQISPKSFKLVCMY